MRKAEGAPISPKGCPRPVGNGEMSPSWLRETRWRAREEAQTKQSLVLRGVTQRS
jgi:hypothetical protein